MEQSGTEWNKNLKGLYAAMRRNGSCGECYDYDVYE